MRRPKISKHHRISPSRSFFVALHVPRAKTDARKRRRTEPAAFLYRASAPVSASAQSTWDVVRARQGKARQGGGSGAALDDDVDVGGVWEGAS